ncbi:MAG: hypothetical protein JY451_02520 [Erythrobacter sp.]|nr:MAG: hypothetical protein JY451_02520 [Erythrobacter sp.]
MTRIFRLALGTAVAPVLALMANPVAAQDTIVVQGERIETADIRSTARDITVGSQASQIPLSRFQRPVCPGVWGMSEENAQAVLDRIVANALDADVPVTEEPGCGANVWVIVVDDVDATFERLHDEDSFLTRHLTRYQLRKVRGQEGSVRGWNLISTRNPDTGEVQPDGFELASAYQEALINGEPPPVNEVSQISRLDLGIRTDIELSVMLVERSALAELDSHALADYATMRLLAYTEPPADNGPVSTVLTLFTPEGADMAPQRMTLFDQAYLRALYRSSPTRPARIAIGNITGLMEDLSDQ